MPRGIETDELLFQASYINLNCGFNLGDTRVLPRAVQQLKMLPRADTKSHFRHPGTDTILHFDSARADK